MQNYIFIVLGCSKGGKDTIGTILNKKRNVPVLHPIEDLKLFLTQHYNQPHLDLSKPVDKFKPVHTLVDSSVTFNDLLVSMFKFFIIEGHDTNFSIPYLYKKGKELIKEKNSFSTTGVRSPKELEILTRIAKETNSRIVSLLVTRTNCVPETSDLFLPSLIEEALRISDYYVVDNNDTLQALEERVLRIYDKVTNKEYKSNGYSALFK